MIDTLVHVGPAAGGVVEERLQDLLAPLGVRDLRVELHRVDAAVAVFDHRGRRALGVRRDDEARRARRSSRRSGSSTRRALGRLVAEQQRRPVDGQRRAAVLAGAGLGDLAAEIAGHELRAVTDPEERNAGVVDRGIDRRRAVDVHRRRDRPRG